MYIHGMPSGGRLFAILIVVALAAPFTMPLCSSAGPTGMPCCKTQGACDLRLQANRCCSMERQAPAPSGPTGVRSSSVSSTLVQKPQIAIMHEVISENIAPSPHLGGDRLWYPPAHARSVPLFVRNASILR